jgi:hypothetical protein
MQNISDCGLQSEAGVDAFALVADLLVPSAGAQVLTYVGEGKPLATVLLSPGSGLTKRDRQQIVSAHPLVCCTVRLEAPFEWQRSPSPDDFHPATLSWMMRSADHIAIWSAPFPQRSQEWGRANSQAIMYGAKFLLTIETCVEGDAQWRDLVQRWKRKRSQVVVFGPEGADAA